MRSAPLCFLSSEQRTTLRRRGPALLLALVFETLFLLALLRLVLPPAPKPVEPALAVLPLQAGPTARASAPHSRAAAKRAQDQPKPAKRTPPPVLKAPSNAFVQVTPEDYQAGDISKLPSPSDGAGAGKESAAAYGPGEGPGGAPLYNAEWYREPTDGELALYLPNERPPGSWGMIACRTIEKYHVDDCRSMGESPPGSGLAKALRLASWQFLVRPPRVGDKLLIGAWVRIRFDFTKSARN